MRKLLKYVRNIISADIIQICNLYAVCTQPDKWPGATLHMANGAVYYASTSIKIGERITVSVTTTYNTCFTVTISTNHVFIQIEDVDANEVIDRVVRILFDGLKI